MSTSFFTFNDIKDALKENKWSSGVAWDLNETTNYEVFDYSNIDTYKSPLWSASKIIDSKVLGANDLVLMNWNTALFTNNNNSNMNSIFNRSLNLTEWNSDLSSLTDGSYMFSYCSNLESFDSDLSSLTDGSLMFNYCSNLASLDSDLSNLTDGNYMFNRCSNLTTFNSDLSNLTNGGGMFYQCSSLESFNSDLSSLTNGNEMFYQCSSLTTFDSDLSNLTDGNWMFYECSNLTSFNSDLSSLTDGEYMFHYCYALKSFNSDLSSLTDGLWMFYGCSNLTTFDSDLSSLTDGLWMFYGCSNLTTFDSDLSSLTNGGNMFYNCKLNTTSVKNIADTINTVSRGDIDIGIANRTPNTEEETAFNTIASKGWTVYVNGGREWTPTNPISATNLTDEEQSTPIPFYAKPIQVTEDVAKYVDANNNYYNIVGAQFIYGDDISTYGMFTSYDHAVEEISLSLGLTKYVKPTESTEEK